MARKIKHAVGPSTRRSLPARGAKTAAMTNLAVVTKVENAVPVEEDVIEDNVVEFKVVAEKSTSGNPVQTPEPPKPVFSTFKTNAKLEAGLCIVRSLGGSEFELVNLTTAADGALSSEEAGKMIASNPALLKMVDLDQKDWDDARVKCQQAVMAADGTLFRFFKFPLELRYKIYEYCFVSNKKLRPGLPNRGEENTSLNLAFLRTSRIVYEEGVRFWRKNTFYIDWVTPLVKSMATQSNDNVQILSIVVNGQYHKDQDLYDFVKSCTNLKELKVRYTASALFSYRRNRPQCLHQTNPNVERFRRLNGFDILCSLRGLEKVEIIVEEPHHNGMGKVTETERAQFESFLMSETTKPKPKPKTKAELLAEAEARAEEERKKRKGKGKKARGRGRKRVNIDDSEDEYDGTSRSWAH